MKRYRVELRATPDTPLLEEHARKQGRTLGPQTVIYPLVYADTPEQAGELAVGYERHFLYRKEIWLFEPPIELKDEET